MEDPMFVHNAWYMVAWSSDIPAGALVSRKVLARPVVLFRDAQGRAHALENRCPHRHVPLHLGRLDDGVIECAYHGLRFGTDGACVHNPHDRAVPRNARVKRYEVAERGGGVWVWLGSEPATSAVAIPAYLDPAAYFVATDELEIEASYLLAVDNILDLSHLEFLHPSTLGSEALRHGQLDVSRDGDTVRATRSTRNERLPRMLEIAYQIEAGTAVDRTLEVTWHPPGAASVIMSARPAGGGRAAAALNSFHFFTPVTATTCRYFFAIAIARDEHGYGASAARIGLKALRFPFETEDKLMLEAQQWLSQQIDLSATAPVALPGDSAPNLARRIIHQLLQVERQPAS